MSKEHRVGDRCLYWTKSKWQECRKAYEATLLRSVPKPLINQLADANAPIPPKLRIYRDDRIETLFAPFGFAKEKNEALIIVVGLTPGRSQTVAAYKAWIDAGNDLNNYRLLLSQKVAFAGQMRVNLVKLMNELRIDSALRLSTCNDLFAAKNSLLSSTSLLRYPVFYRNGKNYGGCDSIQKQPFIQSMIYEIFAPWIKKQNPDALIVPLGKHANQALAELVKEKIIMNKHILAGFPHTSGLNAHMRKQFNEHRNDLDSVVRSWKRSL